ncbi:uncharacterized protein LOC121419548 [Lytechinus variegatus]|uniref:uncharacterized protein LOC121419548 n=1 Tax=Lytechinus variegatus TaxID=7654 RepID=UPI001BB16F65|nr:uncharacterized protein LOC121419548 [Lytechinus variegatus]
MDELFPRAVDSRPEVFKMDQDLASAANESPYDKADVQENALDNPTHEMDTGEQTNVDMPPPPPPDEDVPNDIDLVIDAEEEITEPSALIDVNVVDKNGDVVDEGDGNAIEDPDGVEPHEYSYVDTVNEPVNEEAGPLPSKSIEDKRYETIKLQTEYLSEDEIQRRRDKSLKICLGMFVVVLIGLAVGLIAFFISKHANLHSENCGALLKLQRKC